MSPINDLETKHAAIKKHVECKLARDWDGCLETMSDEPYYEHYPIGIRVRGREAVTEMWTRLLNVADFVPKVSTATHGQWYTEDTCVEMYEWYAELADGRTLPSRAWAVFHFKDGLIASERIYADENAARLLDEAFNHEEFLNFPGVERVTDVRAAAV